MANPHPFAILKQKKPDSGIPHVSLAQRDLVLVLINISLNVLRNRRDHHPGLSATRIATSLRWTRSSVIRPFPLTCAVFTNFYVVENGESMAAELLLRVRSGCRLWRTACRLLKV